jgi:hypothetical protein
LPAMGFKPDRLIDWPDAIAGKRAPTPEIHVDRPTAIAGLVTSVSAYRFCVMPQCRNLRRLLRRLTNRDHQVNHHAHNAKALALFIVP